MAEALADDEEERALFREIQERKQFRAIKEKGNAPIEAIEATGQREPPSLLKQAKHVAKGIPAAAADFVDLPNTITSAARVPLEWAADKAGFELPNVSGSPSPLFGTVPKFSEMGPLKKWKEQYANEEFPREDAQLADSARTALEWGIGGPINAARKITARPDILMAAGATAGEAAADFFGQDTWIGELLGGGSALLASLKKGKIADKKALQFLDENAENSQKAIKNIEDAVARGESGSLAELSQDQGIYNVEQGVKLDAPTRNKLSDITTARQGQVASDVELPFGAESPKAGINAAVENVAQRRAQFDANNNIIEQGIDETYGELQRGVTARSNAAAQASAQADTAAAAADTAQNAAGLPLATGQRPAQTSRAVQDVVREGVADYKAKVEQPAWDEFKQIPDVNIRPIQQVRDKALAELSEVERNALDKYSDVFDQWNLDNLTASGADVQTLFKRMRDTYNDIDPRDFKGPERNLKKVVEAMEEGFGTINPSYGKAKAATAEMYRRFFPEKMDRALTTPPERYMAKLGRADEAGAETARLAETQNLPALPGARAADLKAVAKREGGVDDAFINKYKETIDSLPPETRQQFYDLAETSNTQTLARKEANRLSKANAAAQNKGASDTAAIGRDIDAKKLEAQNEVARLNRTLDKESIAKYSKQPNTEISRILKNKDRVPKIQRIYETMKELGTEGSFRGHIRDELGGMLTTEGGKVTATSIAKTNKLVNDLIESGVLSKTDADYITETLSKVGRDEKLRTRAVENLVMTSGSTWDNLLASGASAAVLSGMPGTQSLLVGGALRRAFRRVIDMRRSGQSKPKTIRALEDFALSPQKYLEAAKGAKTAKEAAKAILSKIVGTSQAAAILSEENN